MRGIGLNIDEVAPVVRLEDRAGGPVAIEGKEGGVRFLGLAREVSVISVGSSREVMELPEQLLSLLLGRLTV